VPKVGQRYRVGQWLAHWVENVAAPPNVSENTHSGYEVDVRVHLIPGIGAHWLDRLEAEHLEKLYAKMLCAGSKPKPSARPPANCGTTKDGYSPSPTAARSTPTPTTTNGKR
jgi:hypothetical protein